MPLGIKRSKALYGILHHLSHPHRYTIARWVVGIAFTLGVAALPLTNTLRFDLWRGEYYWLGKQVEIVDAAKHFAFPFLAVNVAIVLISRFFGRYLCGFVCPVGALARIGEWARYAERKRRQRILAPIVSATISLLLGGIAFSFWVNPLVFLDGSTQARLLSGALLLALSGGLFIIVQGVGLRFCRDFCPSGIYFAILGHETMNGIQFAHKDACTECLLCETVCPMDLAPRYMSGGPLRDSRGFYPEGLSNFANCIRCGDCVIACEAGSKKNMETPLCMGFLPKEARRIKPIQEEEPT